MTLDLLPISRSAPPRGHTPRNLTLFAHQPPTAAASGAEAVPLGSGDASTHPPALPCAGRVRGVTNPLRRGTAAAGRGFAHRTAVFYWTDPYRIAHRTRSAYKGRQLPPVSTTHAQEAAQVVDGETRGVRGVGWVVGAGARRAGRPGSRRGRKAPGRLPGRLLLWASAPPRLTSCRQCGKILHEGSHRRRSQRRPSSMVRQKPGRFRNDRALLYLGHHPRDFRRIKSA